MKVVFPFFAQIHQVLHALPIAAELAARYPGVAVHAAGATAEHVDFIRELLGRFAPRAPVRVDSLKSAPFARHRGKKRTMDRNLRYLQRFDAVVVPERTSLHLRGQLGDTQLIWTRHGAGDRAIGFSDDIHAFDFVLLAGPKIEARLLSAGQIRPGHYAGGIYAKFDWLRAQPPERLFDNDRPTVLYAPHFDPLLSSWPRFGREVLDFFAASERYNLVFAPHVRLFDPPAPDKYAPFKAYLARPNLRIDLGSARSVDMTYSNAADVYLGDVSSQVAEFLVRPRPCLFLDAHGVAWEDDPDYRFWQTGPVLRGLDGLGERIDEAIAGQGRFLEAQRQYVRESFGEAAVSDSAPRAAAAIVAHLERGRPRGEAAARIGSG